MSWMPYYIEVSSRQHEDELRRRLARPRPTLERVPRQPSELWRRLWGRPWSRLLGRPAGRSASRTAGRVTPAGR
jgi:hypothetical protein